MSERTDLISEAKRRLPLPRLMALLGLGEHAKKSAHCPFHQDSRKSFSIRQHPDGAWTWKCYAGCGKGDAIDFLATAHKASNRAACREFLQLAGVTLPPSQPSTSNPRPPFDWSACVAALTLEHRSKLAEWRGYSPEFVETLHARNLIGLFDAERICFPVHDAQGKVVACHYRRKEDNSWRYYPAGIGTRPLVIGDLTTAKKVFGFESQWDCFAALDAFQWHKDSMPDTAAVVTRGAANGNLMIAELCAPDVAVYAFPQNDAPGSKWLADIAARSRCNCFHVVTPSPHKDLNDWTRAGAVVDDIRRAMTEASPVESKPALLDPQNAPLAPFSKPAITLFPDDDVDDVPPAPFPLEALPPPMRSMAEAVARSARVPDRLSGVCVLGIVSAAIGAGLEIQADPPPAKPLRGNLFLMVSAETGTGKSRTFDLIAAPLLDYQERLQEVWRKESGPRLQSQIKATLAKIKQLEKNIAKSNDAEKDEVLRGQLQYKLAEQDELVRRSVQPVILAQDVTTERLTAMMEEQGEVLFSASSDCRKIVSNLMGRYTKNKGETDESFYLAGYSGDHVRVDRGSRPPVNLRRPCLGALWFGQPDLVEAMLDAKTLAAAGFLQRLLLCHSHAEPQRIEGEPEVIAGIVLSEWANLVTGLLAAYHQPGLQHVLHPTAEARQMFVDYHNAIVERRKAELRDVAGFAARWCENAWRQAVDIHAGLHGADAHNHPVGIEAAGKAIQLSEWFATEQLDILAKSRLAAGEKLETEVLELFEIRQSVSARDVYRRRIVDSPESARALLDGMARDGLVKIEDTKPEHGGKSTRIYWRIKDPVQE